MLKLVDRLGLVMVGNFDTARHRFVVAVVYPASDGDVGGEVAIHKIPIELVQITLPFLKPIAALQPETFWCGSPHYAYDQQMIDCRKQRSPCALYVAP